MMCASLASRPCYVTLSSRFAPLSNLDALRVPRGRFVFQIVNYDMENKATPTKEMWAFYRDHRLPGAQAKTLQR